MRRKRPFEAVARVGDKVLLFYARWAWTLSPEYFDSLAQTENNYQ